MSSSFDAGAVYRKVCDGATFTDQEVIQGIEFFTKLERDLRSLGPVFELSANEAGRYRDTLVGFHHARNERKYS